MKSCPVCDFLMADDELLCSTCSEQLESSGAMSDSERARFDLDTGSAVATSATAAATALLDRPTTPAPIPETVRYRSRDARRRAGRSAVIVALLGALIGVLAFMGVRGDGPLAGPLVSWGLVAPPVVTVPELWVAEESVLGSFSVELPPGSEVLDRMFDPADPSRGSLAGYSVPLGDEGRIIVFATDLGRGPDGMRAADSPQGIAELVGAVTGFFGLGEESVMRDVPVGDGRAVDAVFVDEDAEMTSRARFHLGNGRFHALVTSGPDAGAPQLDQAHQRLISGFALNR